jgi:2-dehydro-3-deoxygluconokinase
MSAFGGKKIVTFGEGMIEISGRIGSGGHFAYGGDVLNVSVALARLGHAPALLTALGSDPYSDQLLAAWEDEGIDGALVARHPTRMPGLYAIELDEHGERRFFYWRDNSSARDLFALPRSEALMEQASQADILFLSGITLSLYDRAGRRRIAELADRVRRRGGWVVFDGNFRPRGWPSPLDAEIAFGDFAACATHALPTAEDEALMHGREETSQAIADRWHRLGVGEVVVKLGVDGAFVSSGETRAHVPTTPVQPIDTSGAGDAFDAGYLVARIEGRDPITSARFGHRLAGETILHRGAIPAREAMIAIQLEPAA